MATGKAQVTLRGRFPAGSKVQLKHAIQNATPGMVDYGEVIDTAVTDENNVTTFDGLTEGAPYVAVCEVDGEERKVRVTAKAASSLTRTHRSLPTPEPAPADPENLSQPDDPAKGIILGHLKQQDARDVQQRSSTELGVATPVDLDLTVPTARQDEVQGQAQRSDTEIGQATVIRDVPLSQQEANRLGVPQASSTPLGESAVLAGGTPVERELQFSLNETTGIHRVPDPGRSTVTDDDGPTKAELLDRAKELDIDGRSAMNKAELQEAVARAEASK